jgi:hypothetical protein
VKDGIEDVMKPIPLAMFWFFIVLSPGLPITASSQAAPNDTPRLRLYVGEIKGDEDLIKSIRDHLVDELGKHGVALSPSPEEADVVLTGSGIHQVGTRFVVRSKVTELIAIRGEIQLSARDGRTLWSRDISSARWAVSQTQSFAETAASRTEPMLRLISPRILARP